jgi:hypothetical protein
VERPQNIEGASNFCERSQTGPWIDLFILDHDVGLSPFCHDSLGA